MNKYLTPFIPVAEMITGMFGRNCEAVLHDLTDPEYSVVYVSNGTVTNRSVGQSFDHLIRNVLLNRQFADDQLVNYSFDTVDGKRIKSSSVLIRDEHENVVGMLCVNYDITAIEALHRSAMDFLMVNNDSPAGNDIEETFVSEDIMSVIENIIRNIIIQNKENLTRKKCLEIVDFLESKGIFLVKGSIERVAELLGVSKVTVYSYLDEVKKARR